MIATTTRNGTSLALDTGTDQPCVACDHEAQLTLAVKLPGQPIDYMALCADCLAGALAIHLGRAHVAAGGDVADLKVPEPEPWNNGPCPTSPTGQHVTGTGQDLSCDACGATPDDGSD